MYEIKRKCNLGRSINLTALILYALGNVSPLTPPPLTVRPASPRTPPLPPRYSKSLAPNVIQQETVEPPLPPPPIALPPLPQHDTVQLQEEIVAVSYDNTNDSKSESEMSPVSDTELAEISSPKNMPVPALPSVKTENSRTDEVETPPLPAQEPPLPPEFQQGQDEIAPPPPPPDIDSPAKPPSPLTSPIGSSPDDMEEPGQEPTTACSSQSVMAPDLRTPRQMMQSQYQRAAVTVGPGTFTPGDTQSSVSASDISDTDLPEASGGTMSEDNDQESRSGRKSKDSVEPEDDLEALERAKAELQAKLAATKIGDEDGAEHDTAMDDSDGEVHTDDSNDYMKRFQEIARGGELQPKPSETDNTNISTQGQKYPTKDESSMSPISSEGPTPEPPKVDKENPEEPGTQDDHALEKMYYRKKDDDDDDQPNPSEKHSLQGHSTTTREYSSSEPSSKVDSNTSQGSSTKDGEKKSKHHSSSSRHSHSSHDHQRFLFETNSKLSQII